MTSQATVGAVLDQAGPQVRELLASVEQRLADLATAEQPPLGPAFRLTVAAGGKRLRPLLLLVAADVARSAPRQTDPGAGAPSTRPAVLPATRHGSAQAGRLDPLVAAGVAVELLHTATLVHDDVLDRAPLRRGRESVFAAYGREFAVLLGDLIFARAFRELVSTGNAQSVRYLSRAASDLVTGELLQRADLGNLRVGRERYLERCRLKTASLFEAACAIGATLAGAPGWAEPLGRFGRGLGVAFQLLDDLLDFVGESAVTGKRRAGDLLEGVVTLPLIIALDRDAALARTVRALAPARHPDRARDDGRDEAVQELVAEVCAAVVATGAVEETRAEAEKQLADAFAALDELSLSSHARELLHLIARGVVERSG
ncbi:polyprenyl synthetase family protein [Thermoleophilum album]|uniref:polyprenyl synthetase family protein n=1 Tax=Thermoleophilum album TaxID=29539 RepID=UPI00237CCCFC|nr:polyprenyl synthetase family protein [Thermoleophilum album]WDT93662.1 polyprenyl synthetase family protein [Thermoleophilum album]